MDNIYLLENGFKGSTLKNLSKKYLEDLEIPIPKTPELLEYWENKISQPFMKKQEKERRFNEVEEEIKNKIKDIQENHECEQVKLGDICKFNYGTRITKKNNIVGNIPVYGGGDITFYTNKSNRTKNTLILSRYAMSKTCIRIINNEFYLNDSGLSIDSININQSYINYILINNKYQDYIYNNCATGSVQRNINMNLLKEIKISIPKDKSLIDNLQPLFNEVEELQKEIKELKEIYNNYLTELSKEAIKNQEIFNITSNDIQEELKEEKEEEIQEETISIKSNKSQTIEQLKEQCKALGIKGYSKKKKDELI